MHWFVEFSYLTASLLFIFGLRCLTRPETARKGMQAAEVGMLLAVVGTLLHKEIVTYEWIIAGCLLGGGIGAAISHWVPMTALPQRTALSHAFGALAASLVGIAEYITHDGQLGVLKMTAVSFEVWLGSLTTTGSLLACAKLQGLLPSAPVTFKNQNAVTACLITIVIGLFGYSLYHPGATWAFYSMVSLAFVFGVLFVLPIGAADMPTVMSLLNSYAGLAAVATGFAISNKVLLIAGTLDGFSGFILSVLMCKAMNRSIFNVLFGAFGSVVQQNSSAGAEMSEVTPDDAGVRMAYARQVVFVPGYGMATAQAQHVLRELSEALEARGVTVKFAVHPVAGRMPGHMNVLLAEANIPYSQLYELEQINPDFPNTDVSVVIGANDVVNPDARDNPQSVLAGMPILEVDRSKFVVVLKRGKGKGFAGIENPLFFKSNTGMLFGDAKESLAKLVLAVKAA